MLEDLRSEIGFASPAGHPEVDASAVLQELKAVLESRHFRTSKQCHDLLRYIVEHSLRTENAPLKERIIGMQVFGRTASYDTAEDPVVRIRAADVRKRLAQYYQSCELSASRLHIELQPGSYRASFRPEIPIIELPTLTQTPQPSAPHKPALLAKTAHRNLYFWRWMAASLLLVVCMATLGWYFWRPKSPQLLFWAPLTRTNQPVLVYLGSNAAYVFTANYLAQYRAAHGITNNGPEFFVNFPPNSSVRTSALVPVPNTFIAASDINATVQMVTLLNDWKKPFILRSGTDVTFVDLRNRPSVLIGGFNNPWTLEVTNDLPYALEQGTRIVSRDHPGQEWSRPSGPLNSSTEDYALISRLLQSKTGGPVITAAGIGGPGTQAAAEFLSNPEKMKDMLQSAPPGWENKNMQVVLHVKVVDYSPVAVNIVATSYW